jgi:hypothetical protein
VQRQHSVDDTGDDPVDRRVIAGFRTGNRAIGAGPRELAVTIRYIVPTSDGSNIRRMRVRVTATRETPTG